MELEQAEPSHTAAVNIWLARSIGDASPEELVGRFEGAFEALWARASTTLGSVTLTAIAERVLITATGLYPFLSAINPRPNGDVRWRQHLHERLASVPRADLIEGLRHGLIEFLTVIGRLTAEILTQELHIALMEAGARTPEASTPDVSPPHPHVPPSALGTKALP